MFPVKYVVKSVWWKHVLNTHIGELFQSLKCQNIRKTRLICIFWLIEDLSLMMEHVLVNFEGTGKSFYFVSNFKVLKVTPDTVHGAGPCTHNFHRLFCPENTLDITSQQVSSFKLVGIHLLLKYCLVCIGCLGVKIVDSFQFEWHPDIMSGNMSPSVLFWLL